MLSRTILIVSVVVLLATTLSTAPVEEKEGEEVELELEDGEEELSEEEEDEDDSKSRDKDKEMARGTQQATTASNDLGLSSLAGDSSQKQGSNGLKLNGDSSVQGGSESSSISSAGDGMNGGGGGDPHAPDSFGSLGAVAEASHFAASSGSSDAASQTAQTGSSLDSSSAGSGVDTSQTGHSSLPGSDGHSSPSSSLELQPPADTGSVHSGTLSQEGALVDTISHHVHAGAVVHSFDVTFSESLTQPAVPYHHHSESRTPTHGELVATPTVSQTEAPDYEASEAPEIEFNGNGHKLLNGGSDYSESAPAGGFHILDGTAHGDATGALEPFGVGGPHLDYTGSIDQSSHDFLIGLMGGVDPYGADLHIDVSDPYTAVGSDTAGPDLTSLISGSDQSSISSDSGGPAHTPGDGGVTDHASDGIDMSSPDSVDTNGNGRLSALTGTVEVMMDGGTVSLDDLHTPGPHTDLTGAVEAVTSLDTQMDRSVVGDVYISSAPDPAAGLEAHVAVTDGHTYTTESPHAVMYQTDVSRTAMEMSTDTVTDNPQATPQVSGQTAAPQPSQMAVSATEQYNPSGQGPEGAENVELEDTC